MPSEGTPRCVTVGEVADTNPETLGTRTDPEFTFTYIDLASVSQGRIDWTSTQHMKFAGSPSRARRLLRPGDILFGSVRPLQQSHAYIGVFESPLVASTGFTVFRSRMSDCDARYLFHVLMSDDITRQACQAATGSNYPAITELDSARLTMPLSSIDEQRRIADILDTLDQEIEGSHNATEKLRIILDGLLQDILVGPAESALGQGSSSMWEICSLGDVASVAMGVTLGSEPQGASSVELPYLRVANVQDGVIDTSELKTVRVLRTHIDRYLLKRGDVLLTEGGDFDKLGRGAVWDGRISCCLHQNHIFRVRCDRARLHPEFLSAYLSSSVGRKMFLLLAKQTTNLASINSTQLKSVLVPLPALSEQERIVSAVTSVAVRIVEMEGKVCKLGQIRRGVMDDLLSGKVRVELTGNTGM